jgi:hypothetical protein
LARERIEVTAEHFREYGYFLCEGVFEAAEVEEMRHALERPT